MSRQRAAELVRPGPKFKPAVLTPEERARPLMFTQSYAPATLLVLTLLAIHCHTYCSASDYLLPLVTGYLHTDAYLAALHMWIDNPVTLTCPIVPIAKIGYEFQHHHDYPDDVFRKNHVLTIDLFVRATAVMVLALYWSCGLGSWVLTHFLSIGVWGFVGAANHVAMHCRTHGHPIPFLYRAGQDVGLLMQPRHHKAHHTAPFDCYFSFLQGLNVLYTELYARVLKKNRFLMTACFVTLQPPFVILAIAAAAMPQPFALPLVAAVGALGLSGVYALMKQGAVHDWEALGLQRIE